MAVLQTAVLDHFTIEPVEYPYFKGLAVKKQLLDYIFKSQRARKR